MATVDVGFQNWVRTFLRGKHSSDDPSAGYTARASYQYKRDKAAAEDGTPGSKSSWWDPFR